MPTSQWTAADLPSMAGRTVVVTGAASGLGEITARELARAGAQVVLAVRDVGKGQRVAGTISGSTAVQPLDLANLASIRAFAAGWTGPLDILINNAGIMQVPQGCTADGFELQIGTNHLGHFALTNLLLPHITDRVVTVSSNLHWRGKPDLDDLNWERRPYQSLQAYCDSKLANLWFTLELQRWLALAGSGVRAVAAHPGVAPTNLLSHLEGVRGALTNLGVRLISHDVAHGALPILYAATVDLPGNAYVGPGGFRHMRGYPAVQWPAPAAQDAEAAKRLWEISARLTNTDVPLASGV